MNFKCILSTALLFSGSPCFAVSDSLYQLQQEAMIPSRDIELAPASAASPVDSRAASIGTAADYQTSVEAFEAYRNSKRPNIKNEENLPFIFTHGYKTERVVLMMHGLTDSPWYMKELGKILYEKGYNVVCLLLPGHGTKPEDLLKINRSQWQDEADKGLEMAAGLGQNISLAGFSTGGALSLDIFRRHPDFNAEKLFLFSPAMAINERNQLLLSLGCVEPGIPTAIMGPWVSDEQEDNPYGYRKMAVNAACQLHKLTQDIKKGLHPQILDSLARGRTSVFAVESEADDTVSPDAVHDFEDALTDSGKNVYIWYPKSEGIHHGNVTRPEKNPRFAELREALSKFAE